MTDPEDRPRSLKSFIDQPLDADLHGYLIESLPKPKAPKAPRLQKTETSAAAHAAGHVVVALVLGVEITHASRLTSPLQWGLDEINTHPADLAVLLVAGPISQTAVRSYSNRNHYCPADLAHAADLAAQATAGAGTDNPADTFAVAITRACTIVEQQRQAIWKATDLLENQDLDNLDIIGLGASLT